MKIGSRAFSLTKSNFAIYILLCVCLILNHRFGYITLVGIFSILVFIFVSINTSIDKTGFLLITYCVTYLGISSLNGFNYNASTLVLYGLAPIFFYQFGKYITIKCRVESQLLLVLYFIILCYSIDIFVVTAKTIITTGLLINPARTFSFTKDYDMSIAATGIGLNMSIGMVGLPMFFLIKNKWIKTLYLLLFVGSLLTTVHLLNRTGIFVAAFCFVGVIGYYSRHNIKAFLGYSALILVVIIVLFKTGIINEELLDFYRERNEDLSTMGTRTERWQTALSYLFTNPFGWTRRGETYFIHNMWLDVARISGIVPFCLLVWFAVTSFLRSFKLIKRYNNSLSYLLLGLNICFFASCFVEPIYGGTHFMLYCLLWGFQNGLYTNKQLTLS